jgi:hypothetical protein
MLTFAYTVTAAGAGIPHASWAVLSLPSDPADIVAGLGALVVATIGLLVVRVLMDRACPPPSSTRAPEPGPNEMRTAA